ncbi:hypothetical protein RQP46_008582 [Phenoliferia psychrophenolica]
MCLRGYLPVTSPEAGDLEMPPVNDSDPDFGVTMGRIKLTKSEIEQIFYFCVNEVVASVQQHIALGKTKSTHLILTGVGVTFWALTSVETDPRPSQGFGDSGYLQKCLKDSFPELSLVTPTEEGKKVVADGCLMAFISECVAARAIRATFGVVGTHPYIPSRHDHAIRRPTTDRDGFRFLDGCWSQIVQKGDIMRANEPYERYCYELIWPSDVSRLSHYSIDLWVNLNYGPQSDWATDPSGRTLPGYHRRATVSADLSPLTRTLTRVGDPETGYLVVDFRVCLYLAENTLRAKIKWFENRIEREGPAIVTFDEEPRSEGNIGRAPAANILRA